VRVRYETGDRRRIHKSADSQALSVTRPIRVAAFTPGRDVPSARFRVRQYISALRDEGVDLREYCSAVGTYPPRSPFIRPFWGLANLVERSVAITNSFRHDVTLLQREFLSSHLTLEGLTSAPRVLDVDDAIWLNMGEDATGKLARKCSSIICGNSFIADYFSQFHGDIEILPTAVDTDRFFPLVGSPPDQSIIGWSGSSGGFPELQTIIPALRIVLGNHPKAKFRIVSDRPPPRLDLPAGQFEWIQWSPANEVSTIQDLTVGIMPLRDSEWTRGKCSYKMLLYMACGVPVVASPVGMNAEVLAHGVGFGPKDIDGWVSSLDEVLRETSAVLSMRGQARTVVESSYSVRVLAPTLAASLRNKAAH
jgi:glycosyltransferase involved in cell wall biosynthesis